MSEKNIIPHVFGKRLKYLMKISKETSKSLGCSLHLSTATISRYTRGEMIPKHSAIYQLAKYFDVNPYWLMGYAVSIYQDLDEHFLIQASVFENIVYDRPIFSNQKTDFKLNIPSTISNLDPVFALEISDESMSPTLISGDKVLIKICTQLQEGMLMAVHVYKQPLIIRKIIFHNQGVLLQPHNPNYDAQFVNSKEIQPVGQVIYKEHIQQMTF